MPAYYDAATNRVYYTGPTNATADWYSQGTLTQTTTSTWCQYVGTNAVTAVGSIIVPQHLWFEAANAQNVRAIEDYNNALAVRTPEQEAEAAAQRAASIAALEVRQKAQKAAAVRAKELLLENLTPEQRKTYDENKWFVVEGGMSGKKYRIRDNGSCVANVDVLDEDKVKHRLCAHIPTHQVPHGDNLLAQKMMLEFNEEAFVRTANVHR